MPKHVSKSNQLDSLNVDKYENMVSGIFSGDESAASQMISAIENGEQAAYRELPKLFNSSNHSHIIGITGPPGSGKSTIIGRLAENFLKNSQKVAIIAIDPSFMDKGGSLLIDRARIQSSETKPGIFIRSMADRGNPGGISKSVCAAGYVLEALGKNIIIIESIGTGQSDRGIHMVADTVLTVYTPDFGDGHQVIKAGLLEIADIVVVNKCDCNGAENTINVLSSFANKIKSDGWSAPVIGVEAINGKGFDALIDAIYKHQIYNETQIKKRGEKNINLTLSLIKEEMWEYFEQQFESNPKVTKVIKAILNEKIDPYTATRKIMKMIRLFVN